MLTIQSDESDKSKWMNDTANLMDIGQSCCICIMSLQGVVELKHRQADTTNYPSQFPSTLTILNSEKQLLSNQSSLSKTCTTIEVERFM